MRKTNKRMFDRYNRPDLGEDSNIYISKILELSENYIIEKNLEEDELKKNTTYFSGMVKYIYRMFFNKIHLNYGNAFLIGDIWDTYTELCYTYNKYPSIDEFSIMTGIEYNTLYCWGKKETRLYMYYDMDGNIIDNISIWQHNNPGKEYRKELSTAHYELHKRMLKECENALRRGASESNKIGSIFLLKALYGYTEIAPIQIDTAKQTALTAAELPKLGNNSGLLSDNSGDNTELE